MTEDVQINEGGTLRHLLTLENLSIDLVTEILDRAQNFLSVGDRRTKNSRYYVEDLCSISFLKIVRVHALHSR